MDRPQQTGFKKSRICPLNENIFPDSEFPPSYVTDRPAPANGDGNFTDHNENSPTINENPPAIHENLPVINENPLSASVLLSPEQVRPVPKPGPQNIRRGRKKRQTAILTDTPIREALKQEKEKAKEKKTM
ncbi:hypothetical protein NQ314_005684 [Rhamnusium bicolor]|uniref:Uncharacterized protein n=1 Tax=Rhamnusium bicolor TaxID=1586634 RepID=A0AAV8ZI28_9CUCU|nr:hypothetical protein NQ314_005684 [Rhamnusium bicolor]